MTQGGPIPSTGGGLVPIVMGSSGIIPTDGPKRRQGHPPEVQREKEIKWIYGCDMGSLEEGILVLQISCLGGSEAFGLRLCIRGVPCRFSRVLKTPRKSEPSCYQL